MPARGNSFSARLHADQFDPFILHERAKDTDRIRSSADAGDDSVGEPSRFRQHLFTSLAADYGLELSHHGWVWMGTERRAEQIMSTNDVGYPVADGLIDRVLQRLGS